MDGKESARSLKLVLRREDREIDLGVSEGQTLIEVLKRADLPIDGVLIFDEDKPIPLDSTAAEFEVLTVINVASGG
jgi:sulfur carrier protein ThiS